MVDDEGEVVGMGVNAMTADATRLGGHEYVFEKFGSKAYAPRSEYAIAIDLDGQSVNTSRKHCQCARRIVL